VQSFPAEDRGKALDPEEYEKKGYRLGGLAGDVADVVEQDQLTAAVKLQEIKDERRRAKKEERKKNQEVQFKEEDEDYGSEEYDEEQEDSYDSELEAEFYGSKQVKEEEKFDIVDFKEKLPEEPEQINTVLKKAY